MTAGRRLDPVQEEATRAWLAACQLYRHIAGGHPLLATHTMVVLPREETAVGDVVLNYSRYASGPVSPYAYPGGVAAHWRHHVPVSVTITDRRTMVLFEGQWGEYPHSSVLAFYPMPEQYSFVLTFGGTAPLRLSGPWAPWASLLVAVGIYGPERVPDLPAFRIFAQQTAGTGRGGSAPSTGQTWVDV